MPKRIAPHQMEIEDASVEFLRASIRAVKRAVRKLPERKQKSLWYEPEGPGREHGVEHVRTTVDRDRLMFDWWDANPATAARTRRLARILRPLGISMGGLQSMWLGPLAATWSQEPKPLDMDSTRLKTLAGEFASSVSRRTVPFRARYQLHGVELPTSDVAVAPGAVIRRITDEELWEFGDHEFFRPTGLHADRIPSRRWIVLEIHATGVAGNPWAAADDVLRSTLAALRLSAAGGFAVDPLEVRPQHGCPGVSRGDGRHRVDFPGSAGLRYVLDVETATRLRRCWGPVSRILRSKHRRLNYLRIPAERLLEASGRKRREDSIVDCAIGLEVLLTKSVPTELSYRLGLRGATILTWNGGSPADEYNALKEFTDTRGAVVHGGSPDSAAVDKARQHGESALRRVWWWFLEREMPLELALKMVDDKILGKAGGAADSVPKGR